MYVYIISIVYNILILSYENSMALDVSRQEMGHSSEMWFHPKGAGARAHMDGRVCNVFYELGKKVMS